MRCVSRYPTSAETHRIPLSGASLPTRHVITAVRRGAAEQPAIAAGLAALREVRRYELPELTEIA